jgi:polysaccharide export outer membrane protein
MGEVEKPGEYPYRGNLNVLSATVIAGGPTYRASKSKVYIQREGETAFKEYPLSPAVMIFPGDLVRIPERYF